MNRTSDELVINPTIEQESDPEFAKKLANEEIKTLDVKEYQKWFSNNVLFFMKNHDKLVEKLKESNPEYYHYITNIDDDDVKHIDSFTDGIDLLYVMTDAAKLKKAVFILSYQRKYVDDAVAKIKEILNIN